MQSSSLCVIPCWVDCSQEFPRKTTESIPPLSISVPDTLHSDEDWCRESKVEEVNFRVALAELRHEAATIGITEPSESWLPSELSSFLEVRFTKITPVITAHCPTEIGRVLCPLTTSTPSE